ncbi:type 4a pilus biogenesis protein PilO [Candidatus Daviesbacteria bacterium]|nr:type 4a pilus biogenesis protein PilO [Candidatus Daviesbacteria bacterium]
MIQNKTTRYFTYIAPVLKTPIIKTYGSLIFTIFALIIFTIFAIKPTLETIALLQKELTLQQETLTKISQKSENLSVARKNYQQIDQTIKQQIQTAIPKNVELATLIKSLEGAALSAQASISALQFQPITIEGKSGNNMLGEINFTFNTEGSFDTLKKVLSSLSGTNRSISLDNVSFNKIEGSNFLLMSISGKGYYLQ